MRVGVTGGAGYIAAHVIQDLLEKDHEIVVLDDMSMGSRDNLISGEPRFVFVEGDVGDGGDLARFFSHKPEVIFHFAASKAAGESMTDPAKYSANNIRGTSRLIEAMDQYGCRHIIFSSSAAVYGAPQYLPIDENHPLEQENYYGFTKKIIEDNLAWYSRLKNIRFAALRYFNAAGYDVRGRVKGLENKPNNLLPIIMEVAAGVRSELQIFGTDYDTPDGTCIRDYIHLNDLSRAHVLAMEYIRDQDKDLVVNLGSESGLSVREILDTAREVTGKAIPHTEAPRRAGDPAKLIASSGKARELLGWKPEHSDAVTLLESTWNIYREKFPNA